MDFDEGRDRRRLRTIIVAAAAAVGAGIVVIGLAFAFGTVSVSAPGPALTDAVGQREAGGAADASQGDGSRLVVGNVTFTGSQRLSGLPDDEIEGLSDAASAWVAAVGADASDGVEVTSLTNDTVSLGAQLSAGGHATTVTYDGTAWRYQDDGGATVDVTEAQRNTPLDDVDALRYVIGDQAAASLASDFGAWADSQGMPHASATLDPSKSAPAADGRGITVSILADDGSTAMGTFDLASAAWGFARA